MIPKAKAVWIRQMDAARQAQIAVIVEILGELEYLRSEACELDPNLVAECLIKNVDLNGVIRDLDEAHEVVDHETTASVVQDEHGTAAIQQVMVEATPACPKCGGELAVRIVKNGVRAGSKFLGCLSYPACKGTVSLDA